MPTLPHSNSSTRLPLIQTALRKLTAAHTAATDRYAAAYAALNTAGVRADDATAARTAAQAVAATVQAQAHIRLAAVVTRCFQAVFDEPYEFKIHFEQKRGKTEARIVFLENGHEVDPLLEGSGGVVDVAAFALRVASIMLAHPAPRRIVVMDEPFKFVSVQYRARVRALLEALAAELDMQFIMVTHIADLRAGTIYKFGDEEE